MTPKTLTMEMKLPIKIKKKAKIVVSSCPILDICSQGKTESEAKKNITEAIMVFFITCFEKGTLDTVLKECGFRTKKKIIKKTKPPSLPDNYKYITVPLSLIIKRTQSPECHV